MFIGEDLLFNLSYASNCDKIVVISDALYNYNVSLQNGLASRYDENLFCTEIMLHKKCRSFLKQALTPMILETLMKLLRRKFIIT